MDSLISVNKFTRQTALKIHFKDTENLNPTFDLIKPISNYFPKYDIPEFINQFSEEATKYLVNKSLTNKEECKQYDVCEKLKKRDIKLCKSDKSNILIIMDKHTYNDLTMIHLSDVRTYEEITDIQSNKSKTDILSLLEKHKPCLSKNELKAIQDVNPKYCTFRILPKLHKSSIFLSFIKNYNESYVKLPIPSDLKTRPIVNNTNCITEKLSKLLHFLLKPYLDIIPSFIKDTNHFMTRLPSIVPDNSLLCSFDIESLYTMIPHNLGLESIHYFITNHPYLLHNRFTPNFVTDATFFVLNNCIIKHHQKFYSQINGTAMGTAFAPVYANLTIGFLETKLYILYSQINVDYSNYLKKYFFRYIDDCFIILPNYINFEHFHSILNNLHPSINYTYECSVDKLNFLDVLVIKNKHHIYTDIFYKSTNNFNYLHFSSFHPRHILLELSSKIRNI